MLRLAFEIAFFFLIFVYTRGANFRSSFISAAKKQEEAKMIEICGVSEAKKAVFEAVRAERHECLEFLNVSCPGISDMYGIIC